MNHTDHPLRRFLRLLIAGIPEGVDTRAELADLFAGEPEFYGPRAGSVVGPDAFANYVGWMQRWLDAHDAERQRVALTATPERAVWEAVLALVRDGQPVELPIALVGDIQDGRLRQVRLYHSTWPLYGSHQLRPPLLARGDVELPGVVARYMAALEAGDVQGVLAAFAPDGSAREPAGGEYLYRGQERLAEFYGSLLGDGGIVLEHCTATDDGVRCAVEYNVLQWGGQTLTPQAGVAVYERNADGLLAAARIYDDVEPPSPYRTEA